MNIYNVHQRRINADTRKAGTLIDKLASPQDMLWPTERWPRMTFDSPLLKGARGGHGPVKYVVSDYIPGRKIVFTFTGTGLTRGLDGSHFFEIRSDGNAVIVRHVVEASCDLRTWLLWMTVIGPLHDALMEDALEKGENSLTGEVACSARWGLWVRFLRWGMRSRAKLNQRDSA